jgi:hypothetical protein
LIGLELRSQKQKKESVVPQFSAFSAASAVNKPVVLRSFLGVSESR